MVDSERGTVVRGHAVIQPRMSVTLASAAATDFAILFSGGGGSDPYGALCGELMMDAFAAGGFTFDLRRRRFLISTLVLIIPA